MLPYKKIINTCLLASMLLFFSFQKPSFKTQQLKNSRVKSAYNSHWTDLQKLLTAAGIDPGGFQLYLRAFKQEGLLEAWARNTNGKRYTLLKTFRICARSGVAGPKRKQGDGQVPEGFYEISAFQPQSSYHLALKVSYPNKSDQLKALSADPGGDIMIHGNCVTIGCIPVQDEPIEQLYVLCVEARNRHSVIYTDIYPFKFTDKNEAAMTQATHELRTFWNSLKPVYAFFESSQSRPEISTDAKGNYLVQSN